MSLVDMRIVLMAWGVPQTHLTVHVRSQEQRASKDPRTSLRELRNKMETHRARGSMGALLAEVRAPQ